MQVYEARLRMYHVDCYRLSNPDDFEPLGADDWLGLDGLAVIEWAERVTDGLPPDRLDVRLIQAGVERVIQAWPRGPRSLALATRSGFIPGSSVGFE
jgi:tRNA threonylcarbamoyladenosine biosynthesis protein TsaE